MGNHLAASMSLFLLQHCSENSCSLILVLMCKTFLGPRSGMPGIFVMLTFNLIFTAKSFPRVLVHILAAMHELTYTITSHSFLTALPLLDIIRHVNF